ncbi:hypothetical protein GF406_22835 [candidate division KSB1 bacterium]|nr:hypothetical protein [candidate division KSB1 bacterium]
MPFDRIDSKNILVHPIANRKSKTQILEVAANPDTPAPKLADKNQTHVDDFARYILQARERGASVMLAFGAHLVKNGAAPLVIRMMERGWVTHVAGNGACGIHDWEFAYLGRSEEDVRANVETGSFGTWNETGYFINLAVLLGAMQGMGYGESLGRLILDEQLTIPSRASLEQDILKYLEHSDRDIAPLAEALDSLKRLDLASGIRTIPHPNKALSIFGQAARLGVPATIHPGIGYDIIYNHPFANGAALGRGAHIDYEIFVNSVGNLTNGVFLSVGSAIMAPQVFEKSVSLANNFALQEGKQILHDFHILVDDLQESVWDWTQGEPPKSSPDYYLRFLKSFNRMGGKTHYIAEDNRALLHNLVQRLEEWGS